MHNKGYFSASQHTPSMECPLTPADPKSGSTLLMLYSHKSFCEHISYHVICWHELELEQSLLNLLPEPVIHHVNVLHPGVVFRILGHTAMAGWLLQ